MCAVYKVYATVEEQTIKIIKQTNGRTRGQAERLNMSGKNLDCIDRHLASF